MRHLLNRPVLAKNLVMPLLIRDEIVTDLPGVVTLATVEQFLSELQAVGITGVKIFAAGRRKDMSGSEATDGNSLMIQAIKLVRRFAPQLCVMTETCLCPYTSSGNCALVDSGGRVEIEKTNELLGKAAVLQAEAGAHVVGGATMIQGSIASMRAALDASGFQHVAVAPHLIVRSSLYGFFRQVMGNGAPTFDRSSFQIDASQPMQVLEMAKTFCDEGATMLLVEPAMMVMDVIALLRSAVSCPIGAFSVSGEYKMVTGAAIPGDATHRSLLVQESLGAIKRSGADFIVTYFALEAAKDLTEQQ